MVPVPVCLNRFAYGQGDKLWKFVNLCAVLLIEEWEFVFSIPKLKTTWYTSNWANKNWRFFLCGKNEEWNGSKQRIVRIQDFKEQMNEKHNMDRWMQRQKGEECCRNLRRKSVNERGNNICRQALALVCLIDSLVSWSLVDATTMCPWPTTLHPSICKLSPKIWFWNSGLVCSVNLMEFIWFHLIRRYWHRKL